MANLRTLLEELTKVEGISSAVVVGRDGFVIDGTTTDKRLDVEAVGAIISTGIGVAERMGRELNVGAMSQGMIEYDEGVIVMSFLGRDAILAIVAGVGANLGNVRYQVKKRAPEIETAI
jgi:predicted regulator of Ras-like GTPase activity (Roadblock/LC7/MglB family)